MNRLSWSMGFLIVAALVLVACGPGEKSPATPAPAKGAAPAPAATGWQQKWDALLATGKKEGTVSVYANWDPSIRMALTQAFKAKHGIDVEFTPYSRGPELLAKVNMEQRAGLYLVDFFGGGSTTMFSLREPGISGPIEPLLVLPEVLDTKAWLDGRLPFLDKDKKALSMIYSIQHRIIYNTGMITKGEITGYKDLLNPKYKGKMVMDDPTTSGGGVTLITCLAEHIWNLEEAKEFFRGLLRQDVVFLQDRRLQVESVARGKYAIGISPNSAALSEFIELKAPIEIAFPKEGVTVTTGAASGLSVAARMAHPNAGQVFLNWLLSKEGQTTLSKAAANPSRRIDTPTEGIISIFLPRPDLKLYWDSEDFILKNGEMPKTAKQLIDEHSARK
ncbi:MAG: extracellular solute-binding protein [Chloroflexi bacterium]|nr:extracellular solute-binding protein [Chloroflexota bacterium]